MNEVKSIKWVNWRYVVDILSWRLSPLMCPSTDGRSLLLAPCLADTPASRILERAVLESRVRVMEEENRQIRLQLSQSQGTAGQLPDGNYGNQQWGASADTGPEDGDNTAEEKSNHTECPKLPTVQKCEVRAGSTLLCWLFLTVTWNHTQRRLCFNIKQSKLHTLTQPNSKTSRLFQPLKASWLSVTSRFNIRIQTFATQKDGHVTRQWQIVLFNMCCRKMYLCLWKNATQPKRITAAHTKTNRWKEAEASWQALKSRKTHSLLWCGLQPLSSKFSKTLLLKRKWSGVIHIWGAKSEISHQKGEWMSWILPPLVKLGEKPLVFAKKYVDLFTPGSNMNMGQTYFACSRQTKSMNHV